MPTAVILSPLASLLKRPQANILKPMASAALNAQLSSVVLSQINDSLEQLA